MKKTFFNIVIVSLIAFTWSSCLEKIELDIPEANQDNIAIQGKLTYGDPSVVEVTISKIFDFTGGQSLIVVKEATLIDESGNEVELEEGVQGNYSWMFSDSDPIQIQIGQSYQMRIVTFNNSTYLSTFEPLVDVPKAEDLSFEIVQREEIDPITGDIANLDFLQFSVSTPLTAEGATERSRLFWQFESTYEITDSPLLPSEDPKTCYITSLLNPGVVQTVNGNDFEGNSLVNYPIYERNIGSNFAQGYMLTVFQRSLGRDAYNYWDQVGQSVERDGNMFEAPAGKILSNFVNVDDPNEDVFGYFYATVEDVIRVKVNPEDVGNPGMLCPPNVPPPPGGGCPVLVCCDCLNPGPIGESTLQQPIWWEE